MTPDEARKEYDKLADEVDALDNQIGFLYEKMDKLEDIFTSTCEMEEEDRA